MTFAPHIAIIGGGLIGLSCADSLSARGCHITIYEMASEAGRGAAEFNSGMIHPSQAAPWLSEFDDKVFEAVYALACRSRDILRRRMKTMGLGEPQMVTGTLQLFDSQYLGEQVRAQYERRNIPVERYRGDWDFGRYALKFPDDLSGDARQYMMGLISGLKERGCQFITGAEVRQLQDISGSYDMVLIACGAASDRFVDLPIRAVAGHALIYERTDVDLPPFPVMHAHSHSALTGFTSHFRLSGTVDEDNPEALADIWEDIAPDILRRAGAPILRWTADRPASLLGRPFIGPTGIKDVYVCTGHGHMGWTLCAGSGELMADIILDDQKAPAFAMP